jgi:hypothetical protein
MTRGLCSCLLTIAESSEKMHWNGIGATRLVEGAPLFQAYEFLQRIDPYAAQAYKRMILEALVEPEKTVFK